MVQRESYVYFARVSCEYCRHRRGNNNATIVDDNDDDDDDCNFDCYD